MIKLYYDPVNHILSTDLRQMLDSRVFTCIRLADYRNSAFYKMHIDLNYPNFSNLVNKYLFSDGLDDLT